MSSSHMKLHETKGSEEMKTVTKHRIERTVEQKGTKQKGDS